MICNITPEVELGLENPSPVPIYTIPCSEVDEVESNKKKVLFSDPDRIDSPIRTIIRAEVRPAPIITDSTDNVTSSTEFVMRASSEDENSFPGVILSTDFLEPIPVNGDGEIMVRFEGGRKLFQIKRGSLQADDISTEYNIHGSQPNAKIHLSKYSQVDYGYDEIGYGERPMLRENPPGTYQGHE